MKTAKRALLLALCAILLVVASVMGTLAYLKSTTDVVTNTFTVGKVVITLDESPVNVYGDVVEGNPVTANTYKLIPGHEYVKDPTIHVAADSEDAYLYVQIVNRIADIEAEGDTTIAAQMAANDWKALDAVNGIYYYDGIYDDAVAKTDFTVFEDFTIADDADVASYVGETISIIGYAIQADGFDTAAQAWEAAEFELIA